MGNDCKKDSLGKLYFLFSFFFFSSLFFFFFFTKESKIKTVKEASDIEFQVRSGRREEIPDAKNDSYLIILSTIIELGWSQNPDDRPTFKQIAQKLSPIKTL